MLAGRHQTYAQFVPPLRRSGRTPKPFFLTIRPQSDNNRRKFEFSTTRHVIIVTGGLFGTYQRFGGNLRVVVITPVGITVTRVTGKFA